MKADIEYLSAINKILTYGSDVTTRNSKVKRLRNIVIEFNETPLIYTRRTAWKNAIKEMEWFMSGSSSIQDLHPSVRHWWEPWVNQDGDVWNNYGKQFRCFASDSWSTDGETEYVDQIQYLLKSLKDHPYSRRAVATTWNTTDMMDPNTKITNCHGSLIQVFVEPEDNSVHLTMYQRSADMILGLPHNLIQYWALLQFLAYYSNRNVGTFMWIGGDTHIYEKHFDIAKRMIEEFEPIPQPQLYYKPKIQDEEFRADDFSLDRVYVPIIKEKVEMIV